MPPLIDELRDGFPALRERELAAILHEAEATRTAGLIVARDALRAVQEKTIGRGTHDDFSAARLHALNTVNAELDGTFEARAAEGSPYISGMPGVETIPGVIRSDSPPPVADETFLLDLKAQRAVAAARGDTEAVAKLDSSISIASVTFEGEKRAIAHDRDVVQPYIDKRATAWQQARVAYRQKTDELIGKLAEAREYRNEPQRQTYLAVQREYEQHKATEPQLAPFNPPPMPEAA